MHGYSTSFQSLIGHFGDPLENNLMYSVYETNDIILQHASSQQPSASLRYFLVDMAIVCVTPHRIDYM